MRRIAAPLVGGMLSAPLLSMLVIPAAYRLMRRLTPGPYCFILPATHEAPRILQMKRKTVGIRVPHDEVALAIVRALGLSKGNRTHASVALGISVRTLRNKIREYGLR